MLFNECKDKNARTYNMDYGDIGYLSPCDQLIYTAIKNAMEPTCKYDNDGSRLARFKRGAMRWKDDNWYIPKCSKTKGDIKAAVNKILEFVKNKNKPTYDYDFYYDQNWYYPPSSDKQLNIYNHIPKKIRGTHVGRNPKTGWFTNLYTKKKMIPSDKWCGYGNKYCTHRQNETLLGKNLKRTRRVNKNDKAEYKKSDIRVRGAENGRCDWQGKKRRGERSQDCCHTLCTKVGSKISKADGSTYVPCTVTAKRCGYLDCGYHSDDSCDSCIKSTAEHNRDVKSKAEYDKCKTARRSSNNNKKHAGWEINEGWWEGQYRNDPIFWPIDTTKVPDEISKGNKELDEYYLNLESILDKTMEKIL